jgi:hypothetical protein
MQVAAELAPDRPRFSVGPKDVALRKARTCYDHFAGQLGVALAEALSRRGYVELTSEAGLLTEAGITFFAGLGIIAAGEAARDSKRTGRVLCRPCLDWSERRLHLGGRIGAAICSHSMQQGWTRRLDGTRAVLITTEGGRVFSETFGVVDLVR